MAANDWMAQDRADMLDLTVERPDFVESTALVAAMLAATGAGLYPHLADAAAAMRGRTTRFTPALDAQKRDARLTGWRSALAKVLSCRRPSESWGRSRPEGTPEIPAFAGMTDGSALGGPPTDTPCDFPHLAPLVEHPT